MVAAKKTSRVKSMNSPMKKKMMNNKGKGIK